MRVPAVLWIVLGIAVLGCRQENQDSGAAVIEVNGQALSLADIAYVTVTVGGPNISPDIVQPLEGDPIGSWSGTIENIPAGNERFFLAQAFDADNQLLYAGRAEGVTIIDGETIRVVIYLQQEFDPDPFENNVPRFESLVVDSPQVGPGHQVEILATAWDPDGDPLTYLWSAEGGAFSDPNSSRTNWTAPDAVGRYQLTVSATDPKGAAATISFGIDVQVHFGTGDAMVLLDINSWPVARGLIPDPSRIDLGETTLLDLTAMDPDGDPLSFSWSADCIGTFDDSAIEDPSFTLDRDNLGADCAVRVIITDNRGGHNSAQIGIQTGPEIDIDTDLDDHPVDPDIDGDGEANESDLCLITLPGPDSPVSGCSQVDLVLHPEVVADPIIARLVAFETFCSIHRPLVDVGNRLAEARTSMVLGLDFIRNADVCSGGEHLLVSENSFNDGVALMDEYLLELETELAAMDSLNPDDMPPAASEYLSWVRQGNALKQLLKDAAGVRTIFDDICTAESQQQLEGVIETIDDHTRQVLLTDGTRIALSHDVQVTNDKRSTILRGQTVSIEAAVYGDAYVAVQIAVVKQGLPFWPGIPDPADCLKLRMVPVQQPSMIPNAWVEHHIDGYRNSSGQYMLEEGMRIGAEEFFCPGSVSTGGPYNETATEVYTFELSLVYQQEGGGQKTAILANQLHGGDIPVPLPSDMELNQISTLTVVTERYTFTEDATPLPPSPPSHPQFVQSTSYQLKVLPRNSYCEIEYGTDIFNLEDDDYIDFRVTEMTNYTLDNVSPDTATPITILADGYTLTNSIPSSVPTTVHQNQLFAIRNNDFYPIYPNQGQPNPYWYGVDKASGLMWPHVEGVKNSMPFSYSCELPPIVRDAVAFCSGTAPHTFFRLPFEWEQSVVISQGNATPDPGGLCPGSGCPSHVAGGWQQFAYDFAADKETPIMAARGGIVIDVLSNVSMNCVLQPNDPCIFSGNRVVVSHQDGTIASYAHLVLNSPTVTMGQIVKRGDQLGALGNTGNSTGPHLHFQLEPAGYGNTIPLRFELVEPPSTVTQVCQDPSAGSTVSSTNQ
ncbi:MAG: peptidoglycan DD-metalloendopeptidase family protein [Proteobacteria bacterium]|nr:peptidoglycan DD-metalloendopeptidase family protein [Pseudomonadota bacterium]